ncbi:MAG: glycosyltransferase family 2 protein [Microbacteriaceae bacterium]
MIVPTYRSSDEGLARVVSSLEAQTMPADEFEVIFVDDGSDDDTLARLEALVAGHERWRVIRIENSGWGSRPRNVGIDAAVGEYVAFLDHDDSLYPDALRSAYRAGAAIGADFVNPKETTTRGWSWGWHVWTADRAITDRAEMTPRDVTPLIPHKLYRRAFLNEFGIRFPEGRRMLWEDFYVQAEVYAHARSIAILSSVPFYKWHRDTGENNSDTNYDDVDEHWTKLFKVVEFMREVSPDEQSANWFVRNHYQWWVLDLFGPRMFRRETSFIRDSLPYVRRYLDEVAPAEMDEEFPSLLRARAQLLRRGELAALHELAEWQGGIQAVATADRLEWTARGLEVSAAATWRQADGEPVRLLRRGERLFLALPAAVAAVLGAEAVPVGAPAESFTGCLSVRSRPDRIGWAMPSTAVPRLEPLDDGALAVRMTLTGTVDPVLEPFGRGLEDGVWDVGARFGLLEHERHRALLYGGRPRQALIQGRSAVAYQGKGERLLVDLGATGRSVLAPRTLAGAGAELEPRGRDLVLARLPLRLDVVTGEGEAPASVSIDGGAPQTAVLRYGDGRAVLEFEAPAARGSHDWTAAMGAASAVAGPRYVVGRLRGASFRD